MNLYAITRAGQTTYAAMTPDRAAVHVIAGGVRLLATRSLSAVDQIDRRAEHRRRRVRGRA